MVSQPETLSRRDVAELAAAAARPSTWATPRPPTAAISPEPGTSVRKRGRKPSILGSPGVTLLDEEEAMAALWIMVSCDWCGFTGCAAPIGDACPQCLRPLEPTRPAATPE